MQGSPRAASECLTENVVLGVVRGTLDDDAHARALEHMDGCHACQELVACLTSATTDAEAAGGRARARPRELANGASVGRFRVLEPIGSGAMGIVYLAEDPSLARRVALKMMRGQDAEASARLAREAQALARVSHPNVIVVYEVGVFEGQVFMAMEFAEGGSLADWLAAAPRAAREILDVFVQAGHGLAVAHAAGLVHRDFKPDNVLVGRDGRVRVVDFGLARDVLLGDAEQGGSLARKSALLSLTRTGAFVGTPAYMAPEQYEGRAADARSDQFAFCVALYEALHGQRPFLADSVEELARALRESEARPARRSDVPRHVSRALIRGLRVRPEERFATMDEVLAELARAPRTMARPAAAAAAATVLLGLSIVGYASLAGAPAPAPAVVASTVPAAPGAAVRGAPAPAVVASTVPAAPGAAVRGAPASAPATSQSGQSTPPTPSVAGLASAGLREPSGQPSDPRPSASATAPGARRTATPSARPTTVSTAPPGLSSMGPLMPTTP